jgi:mono/diheme cytochrome c family protein
VNALTDLLLPRPLPQTVIEALLFGTFLLHLAFALLMLGTAIIAFHGHLARFAGTVGEHDSYRGVLRPFLGFEALAVVLGVGPLLLIQVGYTLNFFSAANILAPWWVLLIVLMVVGFLAFDLVEHRAEAPSRTTVALGMVGLVALLAIPGIFVAILVLAEHPEHWISALRARDRLAGAIGWLWLARYLHVLGAAIVMGAAYQLYRAPADDAARRREMASWLVGGAILQVAIGVPLYAIVLSRAEPVTHGLVGLAMGVALALAALSWRARRGAPLRAGWITATAVSVLLVMLLARETLQQGAFAAVTRQAAEHAAAYERALAPHAPAALATYEAALATRLDSGGAIYERSCAFCHGPDGNAQGESARALAVPPERVRELRLSRAELYRILIEGVPGSAMPAFTFYDRDHLDRLMLGLDEQWSVLAAPLGAPPGKVTADAALAASVAWASTCVECHGPEGHPTPFGRKLQPAPPDLTRFSLTPDATFVVLREGYPGTMMRSFAGLPEGVRWALVDVVRAQRVER